MLGPSLTSLAILKVNWDQGSDYIDNFIPFLVECIRLSAQDEISLPELQKSVTSTFGIRIPQNALKSILSRAARHGFVRKEEGIYRRNDKVFEETNLPRVRDDALRQYEALVIRFRDFCKNKHGILCSEEEVESALLDYLEEHAVLILSATADGQLIQKTSKATRNAEFLLHTFIKELYEHDPSGFEFLETIVKGYMLSNVLFFPDINKVKQLFDKLNVFLDTRFLLRALGYAGKSLESACRELIILLYEQNANLYVFVDTYQEIYRILDAASYALRNSHGIRKTHETLEFFIQSGYKSSDIELFKIHLKKSLRALHVKVKSKPLQTKPLGLDETALESFLKDEAPNYNEEALKHDIDTLTAIHRIRKGKPYQQLEKCKAIFVTTNAAQARASLHFFRKEYEDFTVPHCILDHVLTTIAWLKKPVEASDLPRKRMIADSYAAMNPSGSLWRKYLEEIERLQVNGKISEDDYAMLRYSTTARNVLMQITLGVPDAFTEGTAKEVLAKAEAVVRSEAEGALAIEKGKRVEAEHKATGVLVDLESSRKRQRDKIFSYSVRCGYVLAKLPQVAGYIALIAAIYFSLPEPLLIVQETMNKLVPTTLYLLAGVLIFINQVYGTTLNSLIRRLEVSSAEFVEGVLLRYFGPE